MLRSGEFGVGRRLNGELVSVNVCVCVRPIREKETGCE